LPVTTRVRVALATLATRAAEAAQWAAALEDPVGAAHHEALYPLIRDLRALDEAHQEARAAVEGLRIAVEDIR